MPVWLPVLGKGLALGLVGAGINQYFLTQALTKVKDKKYEKTADQIIMRCYSRRFIVNVITLVAAYFLFSANYHALIGTAIGLTVVRLFLGFMDLG